MSIFKALFYLIVSVHLSQFYLVGEEVQNVVFETLPIPEGVKLEGINGKNKKQYGYRIPSLLVSKKNTVLAFSERRIGLGDHAQNDIVLKRSLDGGKTWGQQIMVVEDGVNCMNDPLTVQLENGRILMMYARFPYGRHARKHGWVEMAEYGYDDLEKNILTYTVYSDDDGLTWSKPKDITRSIRPDDVLNANTPGAMIQLQKGPKKDRIITPLWMSKPVKRDDKIIREWEILVAYSDDMGETWSRTKSLKDISGKGFPNESQIAEASDGSLVIISRNQNGGKFRKKTISHDSGMTWTDIDIDQTLPSVACMGSLIKGPQKEDSSWDLYATHPSDKGRVDGQVMVSIDHGKSWEVKKEIKGRFAYSASAISADREHLLCLYETVSHKIVLKKISLNELR